MPPRGRRPGRSGTRERILDAARELFAELGFERTTMRGVAARAEVDPALIHHYFGTKDGLLASALVLPVDPMLVVGDLRGSPATAGPRLVARVLTVWDSDVRARERSLGLLRVAISHERAAAVLRDVLGATALTAVRQVVADDHAELRAGLVASQLGGLLLARYLIGVPALRDAEIDDLVAAIGPVVQHYLTGPL